VKGIFLIVAFRGAIRKFLNMVAAHIEEITNKACSSICLFDTLFRINVSLKGYSHEIKKVCVFVLCDRHDVATPYGARSFACGRFSTDLGY
jgi:hypothetical protein